MRAFYEDLWSRLPAGLVPPDQERRARFLRAHLGPADRVLDLGCGDGWAAETAPPGVRWTGVELAEEALVRARARHGDADWVRIDEDAPLPFGDEAFDVVWCSETLEHVADTARFLSEARRVVRRSGVLLVTVPDHPRLRRTLVSLLAFERAFPPLGDHLRFYTARSLRDALEDTGLHGIEVGSSGPVLLAVGRR